MKRGIDIETTSLDPADGEISLIQVYDPETNTVDVYDVLNRVTPDPDRRLVFNGTGGRREVTLPLTGIAHNATFEERWLREKLARMATLDDTMIASFVLYTGTDAARSRQFSHNLAAVAKRELQRELPKDEQESDWSARPLTRAQIEYAARDAAVLPPLFGTLMRKIDEAGLRDVYDLELRVSHAVAAMERNGFAIHEDRLAPMIEEVTAESACLKAELEAEWGINPGSSKQLREYFELEGREDWPQTDGGAPKTDRRRRPQDRSGRDEPTPRRGALDKKVDRLEEGREVTLNIRQIHTEKDSGRTGIRAIQSVRRGDRAL